MLFYERRQSVEHRQHREKVRQAIYEHQQRTQALVAPQRGVVRDAGVKLGEEQLLLCKGWFARYIATDSPGPVTHADALCPHDAVDVSKEARSVDKTQQCFLPVPRSVWSELTTRFQQTSPPAPHLSRLGECAQCR